ncbi:flagellar biosynthesis protein FlhB [Flocculibacter collagenilyticus]|uniref:flagellar biosynthesis protein FlhB n=1 Tax=Flocculibacter collagenilyticus TaxID=2744479 RepID=UPI0018F36FFA|nr:flagellar biosynthesis protein FlhB [Flocculibacter collagenilyticus]
MADESNKTEKPTPFKLEEAKKKGQVSKSPEVTGLLMLITFSATMFIVGQNIWGGLSELMITLLSTSGELAVNTGNLWDLWNKLGKQLFELFTPLLTVLVIGAIGFNIVQTGPILSSHPIKPDFKRLNPIQGAKKIISIKALFDLFKAVIKVVVIAFVWKVFADNWLSNIMDSYGMSPQSFLAHWAALSLQVILMLVCIMLPFALIDYAFSSWDFEKKMRMSKQDIKDEHKKREGDPQVKQKQKQIQKELLKKAASLKSVKDADVIITNPQHIAVAIKYVPKKMLAPKILAMGEDNNAAIIRKIARTHNVPIVRNIPLARALYKNSIIDGFIPEDCYDGVASIFRTVLDMNKYNIQGSSK